MVWAVRNLLGWVELDCGKRIGRVHDAGLALAQQQRKAGGGAAIVWEEGEVGSQ